MRIESSKIIIPEDSTNSYEASFLADLIRYNLIERGKKLTFETVLSHPAKIEFLKKSRDAGYKNYLYYISTEAPVINIERVRQRVKQGGHPVKESKIRSRYYNSLELLREVVKYTYRAFVFDNSGKEANLILEVFKGDEVVFHYPEIPNWVDKYLLD